MWRVHFDHRQALRRLVKVGRVCFDHAKHVEGLVEVQ